MRTAIRYLVGGACFVGFVALLSGAILFERLFHPPPPGYHVCPRCDRRHPGRLDLECWKEEAA